jgi:FkbM family methyltransferase
MAGSIRSPRKVARRLKVLPLARRELSSWPRFMAGYGLGLVPRRPYRFRSGAQLRIGRGVDHVPIIEVFMRRDYGSVDPGATVLDLGASTGVFAIYAAVTAPGARIIAYEPMAAAYTLLVENVALNAVNVECRNAGVAAVTGETTLYVDGPDLLFPSMVPPRPGFPGVAVSGVTLADIMGREGLDAVDLLKLDVEGAEYDVLYATPADCLARIAEIRMEAHDLDNDRRNPAALGRFLRECGYRITRERRDPAGVVSLWATH